MIINNEDNPTTEDAPEGRRFERFMVTRVCVRLRFSYGVPVRHASCLFRLLVLFACCLIIFFFLLVNLCLLLV